MNPATQHKRLQENHHVELMHYFGNQQVTPPPPLRDKWGLHKGGGDKVYLVTPPANGSDKFAW